MESVFHKSEAQARAIYYKVEKERPKRNAFVFITTDADLDKNTVEDLKSVEGVNEVYVSHGAYDFIVKVSGESLDHLREIVFKKIKNLSNIRSTLTLMVV